MFDDISNVYTEDTDLNVIKSWLIGITDGATWSINDRFLVRVTHKAPMDFFMNYEEEWDEILGWKHDWKVDDPKLEQRAKEILDGINAFIDRLNEKYNCPPKKTEYDIIDSVRGYACEIGSGKYLKRSDGEWSSTPNISEAWIDTDLNRMKDIVGGLSIHGDGYPHFLKMSIHSMV